MEEMLTAVFSLLGFMCLLVALLYKLQEKKKTEKFIQTVESYCKKFLKTGDDYHFLDQEKKK